jgi:hypothetical protein
MKSHTESHAVSILSGATFLHIFTKTKIYDKKNIFYTIILMKESGSNINFYNRWRAISQFQ